MTATHTPATRLFATEVCDNFGEIGAIAPSSPSLARAMTFALDRRRSPRTVLEVGAGTGAVTAALMDRLGPDDRLDRGKSNSAFADALRVVTDASAPTTR